MREALTSALQALPPAEALPPDVAAIAQRLSERLRRDLLPRLSGATPTLLVGIAGPNNVGKSSLFNALVGQPLSPAHPEGGLTRQCLAAVHPSLWNGPMRAFIEDRFDVVEVMPGQTPPVTEPGPPGRLYLQVVSNLPPGLLLMDTPDFDSVHQTNRRAAEALLVTVDVVLFVISRHTYQNAAVVDFLRDVVGHGRPYVLVYNEAMREEVAREHLEKLSADVGIAPVARVFARHQPDVEAGRALLKTEPLEGSAPLEALLRDEAQVGRLKAQALAASIRDAKAEMTQLASALEASVREPERLGARIRRELQQIGERAAGLAIPADVLIEAFRDELDARSTAHRWLRRGPRLLAAGLSYVGRFLKTQFTGPEPALPPLELRVQQALQLGLREVAEALAPEVRALRGDEETRARLAEALAAASTSAPPAPQPADSGAPAMDVTRDRARLYQFCRELLAKEMPKGAGEQLRQLGATVAYSVPALAGVVGAVTVPGVTGGADVVFASALVTTPLLERFVDMLGADVREAVAQAWRRQHGQTLARELETRIFGRVLARLDEQVEMGARQAGALRASVAALEKEAPT